MLKSTGKEYLLPEKKETVLMIIRSAGAVFLLDIYFYRSVWALIVLVPVGCAYFFLQKDLLEEKKRAVLRQQFKELLMLSSTLQRAGYSVENSILKSYRDLRYMYGKKAPVCRLVKEAGAAVGNKGSIGEVFIRTGLSAKIEEIEDFGRIYEIAYKKSGNMSLIMDKAAGSIMEKAEVENEIYVSVSKGRLEMRIMNLMPFFIMTYINLTGRGYFDVMYHNVPGITVMSICLIIYILSYLWGIRIVSIRI
ncbi:MAG: hypothetical protein K5888_00430 [Lachnospiraceae bacterium]|nr:hypothetical protein [Lachnospiraceae bacterium]